MHSQCIFQPFEKQTPGQKSTAPQKNFTAPLKKFTVLLTNFTVPLTNFTAQLTNFTAPLVSILARLYCISLSNTLSVSTGSITIFSQTLQLFPIPPHSPGHLSPSRSARVSCSSLALPRAHSLAGSL